MFEGLLRINNTPPHGWRTRTMIRHETLGKAAFLGIQDIGDIPLLPQLDARLALVARHQLIPHARKEIAQLLRVGMGKFDEFKPIGPGRIFWADDGFRCVMRERAHAASSK